MKSDLVRYTYVAVLALALPMVCGADTIHSFDVYMEITKNGLVQIDERIRYDFEDTQRHGIVREIPVLFSNQERDYRLEVDMISVVDAQGMEREVFIDEAPGLIRIRIGSQDVTVTGEQLYAISYRINGLVNEKRDTDDVYWNITGNQWGIPIESLRVDIAVPGLITRDNSDNACFIGSYQSTRSCGEPILNGSVIEYHGLPRLAAGESLTLALALDKGSLEIAHPDQDLLKVVMVIGPIVGIFIYFITRALRRKSKK